MRERDFKGRLSPGGGFYLKCPTKARYFARGNIFSGGIFAPDSPFPNAFM
jgi:hypothetical protein